ncbi:pre-rRNA-processing protein ESF2 [Achlya hypogyna]|uniref:Pre-rRNA-processing protein ESF2 n=1 Tax=Achlya hypogyna TaxID=1202772 RepID=A0A1V9Y9Y2_ACHHY|nr:pre-rRNA-processing protein ESF2 [Achlya hypogyna]
MARARSKTVAKRRPRQTPAASTAAVVAATVKSDADAKSNGDSAEDVAHEDEETVANDSVEEDAAEDESAANDDEEVAGDADAGDDSAEAANSDNDEATGDDDDEAADEVDEATSNAVEAEDDNAARDEDKDEATGDDAKSSGDQELEDEASGDNDADDDMDDDDLGLPVKKRKKESKKGVVYMSRVPPFMKPEKVRHLLSQYGDIERIYLVEEDKTHRKKRLKAGGNKKVNFTEGWIEFSHKSVAKRVAAALNTKPMGGKKRGFYYDDIWNLKYLKGFKWAHLTEKIAYENRVRDQKLRLEIAQAAKENAAFMERVEQSKQLDKMEERKKADNVAVPGALDSIRRTFRQHAPADKTKHASLGEDSKALLTKVFKKRKLND